MSTIKFIALALLVLAVGYLAVLVYNTDGNPLAPFVAIEEEDQTKMISLIEEYLATNTGADKADISVESIYLLGQHQNVWEVVYIIHPDSDNSGQLLIGTDNPGQYKIPMIDGEIYCNWLSTSGIPANEQRQYSTKCAHLY